MNNEQLQQLAEEKYPDALVDAAERAAFTEGVNYAMKWVSVEDGLPEYIDQNSGNKVSGEVLVTDGESVALACLEAVRPTFEKTFWIDPVTDRDIEMYLAKKITHWKSLPPPPKQ